MIQKVEGAKRQRRSIAKKRKIVEQTMQPGASVARVAGQHGVNANQVFYWRNLDRQGRLGEKSTGSISLLPVTVTDARASRIVEPQANRPATTVGGIHVEFPKARLRIEGRA
ncbi:MAG TPA: transposase, partial [Candidatus Sulfotelmatobacter sp.]|nr:transposase [Candidatus Sulfotelmatobacter sp.]